VQRRSLVTLAAAFWITRIVFGQEIISNGGFELPGLPNNQTQQHLTNGSSFLPGWKVLDDGIGEPLFYAQRPLTEAAFDGGFGVMLNQGSGLTATFRAQPGSFYELALWVRPDDCRQCVTPAPLRVTIAGNVHFLPLVSGWSRQTIQFYATNSINTLELFNPSSTPDAKRFGVDAVSLTKLGGAVLAARFFPGLIIDGVPGAKYQIEAAPNLESITWQTLTNIVIPFSPYLYMDVDLKRPFDYPPRQRIYRATRIPE
jgi:hypothetical protein